MEKDSTWSKVLESMQEKISRISFDTWFKNTSVYKIENDTIYIVANNIMQRAHLIENFIEIIEDTITDVTKKNYKIEIVCEEEIQIQLPKENINYNHIQQTIEYDYNLNSNLNLNYTFDTFMIGDSNRFAHTSALTVAQNPGKIYNPFFIYGKSGLGKTHLMHAIGNYIVQNLNLKVLYVTCDQFINDFIDINIKDEHNKNNFDHIEQFKIKYRTVDVLIIDDIQFLGDAKKTKQELFQTFNILKDQNKQIILSSDRSPDDLKFLEERLTSRFAWGLTVKINPPDYSLKLKIIKNKIKYMNSEIYIVEDVFDFIATNCENDVRHLEGSITRLMAYAAMMNVHNISIDFAKDALQDYIKNNYYLKSNISKIQKAVADYYKISIEDIKSKKRSSNINYPRQVGIYLSRIITDETTTKIGIEFGGRSHSTVIHAYEKILDDIKNNVSLKTAIENIKNNIN